MQFKPRNPVAIPARQRKAGVHGKTLKAERRAARIVLARDGEAAADLPPRRHSRAGHSD